MFHKIPGNLFIVIFFSCRHSFNKDVGAYQVSGTRGAAEATKMKNSEDDNFTVPRGRHR